MNAPVGMHAISRPGADARGCAAWLAQARWLAALRAVRAASAPASTGSVDAVNVDAVKPEASDMHASEGAVLPASVPARPTQRER
ncbi:hypothetical protein [Chiayiivirga flava]|uniref:Uncharacterized protein n=1 Tax=Chiayiivirga flava TaxID=659595 RepID=A0A7W8D4U9_9GAMM|nr:hypothetical protein [Chiayiivirga flava]MBB5206687.1 hypothetical protein [Chiayiivirga flava]